MSNQRTYSLLDAVIRDTLVSLVRRVKWGPTREQLEKEASSLEEQARWERGMCDNHSTANWLYWNADLYRLAAEVRFPREGDTNVSHMLCRVAAALKLRYMPRDDDDDLMLEKDEVSVALDAVVEGYSVLRQRYVQMAVVQKLDDEADVRRSVAAMAWRNLVPEARKDVRMEKIEARRAAELWLRQAQAQLKQPSMSFGRSPQY